MVITDCNPTVIHVGIQQLDTRKMIFALQFIGGLAQEEPIVIVKPLWVGHFGWQQTYVLVKKLYFWPNMRDNIMQYIKTCLICQ